MAAAESAPSPSTEESTSQFAKPEKLAKIEKPDEEKYKRDLAEADKELSAITEKLNALRLKIESSAGKGPNSTRLAELRAELDAVKEKQAGLKSGKSGLVQQIETLKVKIEREQNDLKLKRGKIAYRSTDEVDREIKNLESEVDSGKLKLVDEKKNLKRIADLRSLRKQLSTHTVQEESIKVDITKRKALQDELNNATSTPEAKGLADEFNRIRDEMTKLRSENDEAFAKRGELRAQREDLQKQRDKAYENKKSVQDEYYKQRDAYRVWTEQTRKAQSEKYWKQREEEERARLVQSASSRLEEASQEAFTNEIWKCENLLRLFGSGEGSTTVPKSPTASLPSAPTARTVENTGLTKLVSKKNLDDDDLLTGKKKHPRTKTAQKATAKSKGLVLSMDVMKTLGELGVALPTSEDNVKTTVEQLKTKLAYYKENQARATQENIAKAKKENEEIERKCMAAFNDKKEADLSGKRNPSRGRKGNSTPDRKGKTKDKVNGHSEKGENGEAVADASEKEETSES